MVRYLKGTKNQKLHLSTEVNDQSLYAYSDANFGKDQNHGKSNSGLFVGLKVGALTWSFKKQHVVALSTTEAEYIALCDAAKEVVWIRRLCSDFGVNVDEPTQIYEDNQSCIRMLLNDNQSSKVEPNI